MNSTEGTEMEAEHKKYLDTAADTLASMCIDYKMGGITPETFVNNVKLFSDQFQDRITNQK